MESINADELFTATIGEIPRTANWASDRLAELPDGGGILKRLMAAVMSASARGIESSEWQFTPTSPIATWENGAVDETSQDGVFTFASDSGHWSARRWRFEVPMQVSMDECGAEGLGGVLLPDETAAMVTRPGRAAVSSSARISNPEDVTEFTGACITHFAAEIMRRCVVHSWIDSLITPPAPEWHSRAAEGLAQLVYDLDERSESSLILVQYLSGSMHVASDAAPMVLADVLRSIWLAMPETNTTDPRAIDSAFAEWKAGPELDLADAITARYSGLQWRPSDAELAEIILDAAAAVSRNRK
jgi:hypothetical protein